MKECPKCKDHMVETSKKVHAGLGRYKTIPSGEYECSYCIWKGDAGPGACLKSMGLNPDFKPNGKARWSRAMREADTMERADPIPWDRSKRKSIRRACLDRL